MEDIRGLVPREPPEGFLDWAEKTLAAELDTHGLIYEQTWVEDWGLEVLLDEWAGPKKRRMVRIRCSFCGHEELLYYGRGQRDYGFIPAETYSEVEGGSVAENGDALLCPCCQVPVQARKRADVRKKGWYAPSETRAMSASVVGRDRLLVLTAWVIQRRVYEDAREALAAIPAEAYVFSDADCAQLMGWCNAYSGTAGYFVQYTRAWRQPKDWSERWGAEGHIFGLTPELVAESCLPHCKLDVYMEPRPGARHFPVAWLRLCQAHPNAEAALVHGLPRVLDDLIQANTREDLWEHNKRGRLELPELDWEQTRPAQMLRITKDELRMAREQDWGVLFWELYRRSKEAGEVLTEQDICNAFCLGDDRVGDLVGRGPVSKSIRYLLRQCEQTEVEDEDEDPPPYGIPDVQTLTDYWDMAAKLGWDLTNGRVRFPRNLIAAHDEASVQMSQKEEAGRAHLFRVRRRQLSRWSFAADGLLIRPAASQQELTDEGKRLDHCVGTYGQKHANGKTAIFFIRRKARPKEPFYTLELDEAKLEVRQNRGRRNCPRTPEVRAFEDLWLSWVRFGAPRDERGKPVVPAHERKGIA